MGEDAALREPRYSPAVEDYLKTIHQLEPEHSQVTTSLLAEKLGLAAGSVTGMLQKLARLGLVMYTPYRGVVLTEPGRRSALEVLRHHRLLELYLVKELGYSRDEAHVEAEVLEHAISEQMEARIAKRLGNPVADPPGDPVPLLDLTLPPAASQPLALLPSSRRRAASG